jgi:hypothetical protein
MRELEARLYVCLQVVDIPIHVEGDRGVQGRTIAEDLA